VKGPDWVNQVSRIDVESGAVSDLYSITASDLGFADVYDLELGGLSIDPSDSSLATLTGAVLSNVIISTMVLFQLDLETGSISGLRNLIFPGPYSVATSISYAPDATLFTVHSVLDANQVATIDAASGLVSSLDACPPATCDLRSIEFDPTSGALYGVDKNGNLLLLSPDTGAILETLGPTGLPRPGAVGSVRGMAFVTNPEPATGSLLALGLAVLAARRRRARH
jgi:hypothetical protein